MMHGLTKEHEAQERAVNEANARANLAKREQSNLR